jgi:peptidyl-tRNA hydrolase, PTH1 family
VWHSRAEGAQMSMAGHTTAHQAAGERWLVVGLGNPGPRFSANRHNAGFMVADLLGARIGAGTRHDAGSMVADLLRGRLGTAFRRERSGVTAATGRLGGMVGGPAGSGGTAVIIAKPMSFMNLSGGPVAAACRYHKIPPTRLVVIHDELDLPFATIRLKFGGGDNGHNGLRSLTGALGTRDFYRVRIGIGRPPGRQDPADFVLTDFSATERKELPLLLERAADAVESLLAQGLAAAQNEFHTAAP